MIKSTQWFGIFFAIVVAMSAFGCTHTGSTSPTTIVPPSTGATPDYAIGAGDLLEISVWKDPALTRQVVVLPDGTISFPLVGRF